MRACVCAATAAARRFDVHDWTLVGLVIAQLTLLGYTTLRSGFSQTPFLILLPICTLSYRCVAVQPCVCPQDEQSALLHLANTAPLCFTVRWFTAFRWRAAVCASGGALSSCVAVSAATATTTTQGSPHTSLLPFALPPREPARSTLTAARPVFSALLPPPLRPPPPPPPQEHQQGPLPRAEPAPLAGARAPAGRAHRRAPPLRRRAPSLQL
jgi:hypothetical protein